MNADKGAYQLSHLCDQLIQRASSDDEVTKTRLRSVNTDERAYQFSHLCDQLIQRASSDDEVTKTRSRTVNADEGAYQLSHLYDQLIQRASSDDEVTKARSRSVNADEGAYQLSHLCDQLIQRASSDDEVTKARSRSRITAVWENILIGCETSLLKTVSVDFSREFYNSLRTNYYTIFYDNHTFVVWRLLVILAKHDWHTGYELLLADRTSVADYNAAKLKKQEINDFENELNIS